MSGGLDQLADVGREWCPSDRVGQGHGGGEQIPLPDRATQFDQDASGLVVLDAFGDEVDTEFAGQLDDRPDQATVTAVGDAMQERAIELDDVDDRLFQMAERDVACPAVVDRDAQTQLVQLAQAHKGVVFTGASRAAVPATATAAPTSRHPGPPHQQPPPADQRARHAESPVL